MLIIINNLLFKFIQTIMNEYMDNKKITNKNIIISMYRISYMRLIVSLLYSLIIDK